MNASVQGVLQTGLCMKDMHTCAAVFPKILRLGKDKSNGFFNNRLADTTFQM